MNLEEQTLCSLMQDLNTIKKDRYQEVLETGRKLNFYIDNYNKHKRL